MVAILTLISAIIALAAAPGVCSNSVTLVKNGRPASIIVIAENPTEAAQQGAKDMQMWLQRISGAKVQIKSESKIEKKNSRALILVGDTKRSRNLGINPDKLNLEDIIVRTFPQALVVIGDDERPDGYNLKGTVLAVDAFAEQILGVRVLWPGELGEIVPHQSTIAVNDVDIYEKPILVDRRIVNLGYNGSFGHAFGDYWDRFHKQHPDWFALQPDGTRDNSQPEHAGYPSQRLCVSNQELIEQVAQDIMEKLEKNPQLDAVSVSPNDGGNQTFCLCKKCESWDAPEGKIVQMKSNNGPIPHVSLTDRYVKFYSEIAKIVAKKYPNRYIGAYAYHLYLDAPIHTKLHPNVVIGFVPGSKVYQNDAEREQVRSNWLKWSKTAKHLFLRPNSLMALHALPTVYVHKLGEDLRFFTDHKMMFARYDCNFHHWATNGINYYVLAKLLWDPYRDVDEIVDEYCTVGFGPAAGMIHQYFNEIEKITNAIAAERQRPTAATITRYFTDETITKLDSILI
ncbi:MAG: DUF4838 domain-containing protein [Actinobacteria bacterium]|nr:DUF4838 domain-containing protein [Actinomycetota bacterium]